MHFPAIWTPWIWNFSPTMVGYTGLTENPNLKFEIFFERGGAAEKEGIGFEIGDPGTSAYLYSVLSFGDKK